MKLAWIVAFALPALSSFLSHPQQTSSNVPTNQTSSDAKATTEPVAQDVVAGPLSTEEDLRQLVGKELYIRGLWLGDDLHFDMYGDLAGQSPKGSFTLCAVEIEHVRLTKKRVELEGVRYGIHFADEGNWATQSTSFDRIRVTPKKKHLVITIDRQQVVVPKKKNEDRKAAAKGAAAAGTQAETAPAAPPDDSGAASETDGKDDTGKDGAGPTTMDPAKAADRLRYAVNRIFAPGLDAKMIAEMPEYWKYFYQAQLDHKSIEPTDPSIVRPGPGVDGPKLLKNLVPVSNEYAQRAEVVGVASYKVILDPAGKPLAVAVYRPIGFGLDETAVEAIRKSSFAPAVKDGKAMSSVIDMTVAFRIYSKRTAASAAAAPEVQDAAGAGQNISPVTGKPSLPGLFTVQAEAAKQ
jgi:TonB family protein